MAELRSESKLVIELAGEEIEIFAALISEIRNAYKPPKSVGFQIQPKFDVPEHIGEFSLDMYVKLFGDETEDEEN
jgi:hypothetical protein